MNQEQLNRMELDQGFIAALDQSGGSTPKALKLYGVGESAYSSEDQMFDLVHEMRARIIKSPVFTKDRILGVILFEMTMNRTIDGIGSAEFLWQKKGIVPFLKIDNGLADESDDVQILKPIPELTDRLSKAKAHGIFGTKMRSVIKRANPVGIAKIVDQQFHIGQEILDAGFMPILEPEVDIKSADKSKSEELLKGALLKGLESLGSEKVMFKLSLPTIPGFYTELAEHPNVLRVVALSGGYSRAESNSILVKNPKLIASFSRALAEGLSAQQSDVEFDKALNESIESIYTASVNKLQ